MYLQPQVGASWSRHKVTLWEFFLRIGISSPFSRKSTCCHTEGTQAQWRNQHWDLLYTSLYFVPEKTYYIKTIWNLSSSLDVDVSRHLPIVLWSWLLLLANQTVRQHKQCNVFPQSRHEPFSNVRCAAAASFLDLSILLQAQSSAFTGVTSHRSCDGCCAGLGQTCPQQWHTQFCPDERSTQSLNMYEFWIHAHMYIYIIISYAYIYVYIYMCVH